MAKDTFTATFDNTYSFGYDPISQESRMKVRGTIVDGLKSAIGRHVEVLVPIHQIPSLIGWMARYASGGYRQGVNHEYESLRAGASWLRSLADELDAEAERVPAFLRPRTSLPAAPQGTPTSDLPVA